MDYAHGHYHSWCECCVLGDLIFRAQQAAARLPGWQRELATACGGEPVPDPQELLEDNVRLRAEAHRQWLAAHYEICGKRYSGNHALNYAAPHPEGEWCYWPEHLADEVTV